MSALSPFLTLRLLARLNVAAVALSLAACTMAALGAWLAAVPALVTGLPTLAAGLLWATQLRSPTTLKGSRVRVGWVLSIPLAIANAGVACALMLAAESSSGGMNVGVFAFGALLGATFGSIVWIPALLLTLVCFGLPIARAQQLAERGLAGAERGEVWVGASCVAMSLIAALFTVSVSVTQLHSERPVWDGFLPIVAALLGALAGGAACLLALRRERARARFVASVERGEVPGFRVDATHEGKALVRVAAQDGAAYRVVDFAEPVCLLDDAGRATEARAAVR